MPEHRAPNRRCVRRLLTLIAAPLWLGACGDSSSAIDNQISQAQTDSDFASNNCAALSGKKTQTDGAIASSEADIAEAAILDGPVTPTQEASVREQLAAETGLLPSQVNGWRSVLRDRADNARRELAGMRRELADETKAANEACAERDRAQRELLRLKQLKLAVPT